MTSPRAARSMVHAKAWASSGLATLVAAIAACGASASNGSAAGGPGGQTTTTQAPASSSSSSGTTGTGGTGGSSGDPCASGADCTKCMNQQSCIACETTAHPAGAAMFNGLINCILCKACYTVCESSTQMGLCTGPPAAMDQCDTGTPSMPDAGACGSVADTSSCIYCAQTGSGTCAAQATACTSNADCTAFQKGVSACPAM